MKGRIDNDGFLWIKRGKVMKLQRCKENPYYAAVITPALISNNCGDWCPLFGDQETHFYSDIEFKQQLKICDNRILEFEEFADERISVEDYDGV